MLFTAFAMAEKTEEATPRRLRKAREEGDAGVSAYAAQSVGFLAAAAVAPAAIQALADRSSAQLRAALAGAAHPDALRFDAWEIEVAVLGLALPVIVAAGATAAVVHLVQTGGVMATGKLAPRIDRLDPVGGFLKLFTMSRVFAVARALVAGALVGWLAWRGLLEHVADLAHVEGRTAWIGVFVREVAGGLVWKVGLLGIALGVVDLLVVRGAWLRRLRMSKDEVRREYKESEGDPQLKAARERAHHEMLAEATVQNVRTATVVVVNPTHAACALRYEETGGDEAPVVVAAGEGDLAARIRRAAEQYGVPVVQDVPLARALVELAVGDVIPEALYEAVAEVLRAIAGGDEKPG